MTMPVDESPVAGIERSHVRGSSLLLVGRLLAMVFNLVVQVVAVRYLGKTEYGVFAYAVATTALASSGALLGQDQALSRFLPRFEAAGDPSRARGVLVVAFGTVSVLGTAIAAVVIGLHFSGVDLASDKAAASALVVLIASAPLLAMDEVFINLFAVVARPRAIFFRRYVLTPGLRVVAVLFVVATAGTAQDLAWAYLVAAILGVVAYTLLFRRALAALGDHVLGVRARPVLPVREMWGFGAPVYASDMVAVSQRSVIVILLEAIRSVQEVATYRAVVPIASMNMVGFDSFRLLYFPVVSRLFHEGRRADVRRLYWQSAAWIAVVTFPVVVATTVLAVPLAKLLFGHEFADSGSVLAILSVGLYLNAALGLNTHTLRASGHLRLLLAIDGAAGAYFLVTSVLLISAHGAVGAAIATASTLAVQNAGVHLGLGRVLGSIGVPPEHRWTYGSLLAGVAVLAAFQLAVDPQLPAGVAAGVAVSAAVLVVNRRALDVRDTFPELAGLPVIGRLFRYRDRSGKV